LRDRSCAARNAGSQPTSKRWRILHEMVKEGAWPETIWELAREMPSGVWEWNGHQYPLLPRAEG
jgi:hypothetical protein